MLPLAAVGTTALVVRYCYLVWRAAAPQPEPRRRQALAAAAWGAALVAVAAVLWLWPDEAVRYAASTSLTDTYLWLSTWPVLLGLALAAITWAARSYTSRLAGMVPPGDLYAPVFSVAHELLEARDTMVAQTPASTSPAEKPAPSVFARTLEAAGRIESGLLVWASAMTAAGTLTVIVLILALTAGR